MIRTIISPNEVFDREAAQQALDLSNSSLRREIRLGRLRCSKRGGRYYFLGSWILEWLSDGEIRGRKEVTHTHSEMNG